MASKRKDPGRAFSPARKVLSRSGVGLCNSPRRKLSTSLLSSSKLGPSGRTVGRVGVKLGTSSKGASSANMKVVVRVRPLSQREQESNAKVIVDVVDEKMVVFDPKREEESFFFHGAKQKGRDIMKKQNKHTQYLFDRVFGCEASNEEVFEGSTKSIVSSVLDGFNCSVFVYGATGAGKTFTMLGSQENPGITFRTMVDLFKQMDEQQNEKSFEIGVSYLEVYNETVRDLLNPTSGPLHLREDGGAVMVAGLKTEMISNPNRMFELLEFGNKNRTQHPTDANAESSRSHAVFQVFIKMKNKMNGQTKMVKLSMIDLAGSERGAATGCVGARFKEGSNINKSLLALGNCINALADGLRHVPYRDSKLTRLLKDSLGGNCQTVMIANVAPAHQTYEDTHNTLKYATRAKSIKFQIKRNIVSVELHVSHYIKMVDNLQSDNDRLKNQNKLIMDENERLKKELAEYKARSETVGPPEPVVQPSQLPPAVAAAVAAINIKNMKPPVSTSSVAVSTSPLKVVNEDMRRLKQVAEKLYQEKARINLKSLSMNSSDKVLRLRIKMKQRTIDRVQAMSSTPSRMDLAQTKVENSVRQFEGRLNSVSEYQETMSAEEREIDDQLLKIEKEMQSLGIYDEISPYLEAFRLQYLNQELHSKCKHLETLVEYLDQGFEKHDEMLQNVSALFRKYYNLVRGHGHMNDELQKEHEAVMRDLEGKKGVRWESKEPTVFQSPAETVNMPTSPQTNVNHHPHQGGSPLLSKLPVTPEVAAASSHPPTEMGNVLNSALLQSPLCTSSSNPNIVSKNMDTASMLNSLEILDSKVDNILNTSVSSTAVEVGYSLDATDVCQKPCDKVLNVTFDADNNLNSTFTKEDSPEKSNLNQTFDKPEDNDMPPNPSGENLNGTFCLEKDALPFEEVLKQEVEPQALTIPPPQMFCNGSPLERKAIPSSQLKISPLMKPSGIPSLSPSSLNGLKNLGKKDTSKSSPSSALAGHSRKPQTSACVPILPSHPTSKKSPLSVPLSTEFKKPSSNTPFAVPSSALVKRSGAGGSVLKRKAFGSNALPIKPTSAGIGKDRKFVSSGSRLHIDTPSKVKLAWNKENRNATVTTLKSLPMSKGIVGSTTKLTVKPPVVPVPLNDTFTKPSQN